MAQQERQALQRMEGDPARPQQQLTDTLGITRPSPAVHGSNRMQEGFSADYVAVVGGVNVDIGGHAAARLIPGDSNPGSVTVSLGGVGRNIAHNIRLLGLQVRLLTAYGDDLNGERVAAACSELGIDLSAALRLPGKTTSTYLYLTGPEGELAAAVSDMAICEEITPAYLAANGALLQNARIVVADTNIPQASLEYLARNCRCPLFVDPVSTAKAGKLRPILGNIHTLKPNRLEAELLTGMSVRTPEDALECCGALLELGVHRVFLSLGAQGVCAAMGQERLWLPNLPGAPVNTTGCGDAFMAALVWAYLEGSTLRDSALAGLAAASIAMESPLAINPRLSAQALKARYLNCVYPEKP